jgi:hypothetical protein
MRTPAPATLIALVALFVAVGGTTYAATSLPANSVGTRQLRSGAVTTRTLHAGAVTGSKVAPNSLTGTQINSTTLGTVPSAAHAAAADRATRADRATNADHAANADHATNSDELAGSPASTYLPSCPGSLHRAPKTDLCFDVAERSPATWTDALKVCALAGLRLPDAGALAQAFNDLDAFQEYQWTTSLHAASTGLAAGMIAQDTSRTISVNADLVTRQHPFRCVTTAYN